MTDGLDPTTGLPVLPDGYVFNIRRPLTRTDAVLAVETTPILVGAIAFVHEATDEAVLLAARTVADKAWCEARVAAEARAMHAATEKYIGTYPPKRLDVSPDVSVDSAQDNREDI